ncbi:ABC transporter permease [Haloechinothrix salitolerans]|uniref:MlaE family ABC transporter permease n=1 Tax=Haloechinothrix salitolerans TaxID=926830 RepID=A0ABW2BW50_9PSEU
MTIRITKDLERPNQDRGRRRTGERPGWVSAAQRPLLEAGEITQLFGKVIWSAARYPVGYWTDVRDQMYDTLRRCAIPIIVSTTIFGFAAPGMQGGAMYSVLGIPERLGSFLLMASVREFAPWLTAMIVAGVMGTAITADLGSRRIRDELDAMQVLGIDPVRTLIVPRVIAVTVMTGLLVVGALVCGVFGGYLVAVLVFDANGSAFVANFWANATTTDIWGSVIKTLIFGLLTSVVCCYKGLSAQGGPIGVGRAVNQAVVISFVAVYVFNYLFTTVLLGLNPDMHVFK